MNIDTGDGINVDISYIAEQNHRYAIHLSTFQNVITYHNGTYEIANIGEHSPFETVDFWRNISLAAEILLKACLLKHNILFFKKRAHSEYGETVTALSNVWLDGILKKLEINYVAQINTGTISTALKNAENKLFEQIQLPPQNTKLISQMFYVIIRTRRNRNSHFFFPNQSHINIAEIEMLFLPLLNQLEEVYGLPSYQDEN
ncbi:hypothetical protein [Shewanella polaris]|uniref:Cthe-2314-like HEPN domain-containing protein n=1 Tax=Shewanella polaris TaxID=2588449 RepID=A0A4Y5YBA1_9GAMM|nr:hypothetical protein [Shewanella polaris]QDE30052.1 hypothetical protein FH971_03125 [Shewanella polaris]